MKKITEAQLLESVNGLRAYIREAEAATGTPVTATEPARTSPSGKTAADYDAEIAKYLKYPQSNSQIISRLQGEKEALLKQELLAKAHAQAVASGNAASSATAGAPATTDTGAGKPTAPVDPTTATKAPRQWNKGVLGTGSTGPEVSALQKQLGVPETGTFDTATKNAVITKQKELGVAADGAWGPVTSAAAAKAGTGAAKPTTPTQAQTVTPVEPTAPTAPAYSTNNPHVPKPDTSKQDAWEKLSPEQQKWLGNADPTDPYILARMRSAVPDAPPSSGTGAGKPSATKPTGNTDPLAGKVDYSLTGAKPAVKEGLTVGYSEDQSLARIVQLSRF